MKANHWVQPRSRALTRNRARVSYLPRHSFWIPDGSGTGKVVRHPAMGDKKCCVEQEADSDRAGGWYSAGAGVLPPEMQPAGSFARPGPQLTDGWDHSRRQIWHSGVGYQPVRPVFTGKAVRPPGTVKEKCGDEFSFKSCRSSCRWRKHDDDAFAPVADPGALSTDDPSAAKAAKTVAGDAEVRQIR